MSVVLNFNGIWYEIDWLGALFGIEDYSLALRQSSSLFFIFFLILSCYHCHHLILFHFACIYIYIYTHQPSYIFLFYFILLCVPYVVWWCVSFLLSIIKFLLFICVCSTNTPILCDGGVDSLSTTLDRVHLCLFLHSHPFFSSHFILILFLCRQAGASTWNFALFSSTFSLFLFFFFFPSRSFVSHRLPLLLMRTRYTTFGQVAEHVSLVVIVVVGAARVY